MTKKPVTTKTNTKKTPTPKAKKTATVVVLDRKMTEARLKASYHDTNKLTVLVVINIHALLVDCSMMASPLVYISEVIKVRLPAGKNVTVEKFRMEEVSIAKQTVKFKVTVAVTDAVAPVVSNDTADVSKVVEDVTAAQTCTNLIAATFKQPEQGIVVPKPEIPIFAGVGVAANAGENDSGLPYLDLVRVESWFSNIPATAIIQLAREDWRGVDDRNNRSSCLAVGIINYLANTNAELLEFLEQNDGCKFEVEIDPNQAMDWLEQNAETLFTDPLSQNGLDAGKELIDTIIKINKENAAKRTEEQS